MSTITRIVKTTERAAVEPLWNIDDLAGYLACSTAKAYRLVRLGQIPCVRVGASLRFMPGEIKGWLLAQKE